MSGKKVTLNEKQIIRAALTVSNSTIKGTAEKIGTKANAIANQLGRTDSTMTLTSVYAMLDALGFELVVRDKDACYGGKEYIVSEDTSPIPAEKYAPIVDAIKATMKPPTKA